MKATGKTVFNALRNTYLDIRKKIHKLMVATIPRNKSYVKFLICYVTVDPKYVFDPGSFLKDFSVLRSSGVLGSVDW